VRSNREKGVALITALLILFLISAIIVGMSWMVMTDQRLGGNNKDRQNAFYGAEAGMEKMTADVGTQFSTSGAVTAANITTITGAPPAIPGIQFLNAVGVSTYQITPLVPVSQNATVLPPSPYSGMQALITPLTLTVAAQTTTTGAEVKLQRTVQVVAIPVFQFGIYSDSDLAFFNGPPFDFGGRVHTNGNLWAASNAGPIYLADKVTVVGQVIRTNLENGYPGGGGTIGAGGAYSGTVTIATTPTPATEPAGPSYTNTQWRALALTEGSTTGSSVYGAVSGSMNNPTWNGTVVPAYNGQLANNVPILSLTATALGGITSPISLIRRAIPGELASNPAEFTQQLFSEASLRIMLDDYGPSGTCTDSAMMSLDTVTATTPIDLANLAFSPQGSIPALASWYTLGIPLPLSQSTSALNYTVYSGAVPKDGYWVATNKPIITGCIKIEYQNNANTWADITQEILKLGFTGQNIYPQNGGTANSLLILPADGGAATPVAPSACANPAPNSVIRLARVRDNPSTAYSGGNFCFGALPYDYWPMVLYDTREAVSRDTALPNNSNDAVGNHPQITAEGVMNYVELDVANLSKWFTGTIGVSGPLANNNGGYTVYFSDRRGNQTDPVTAQKTGSFGFNDIVNPSDSTNGCPNGVMDQGEDFEGDTQATPRTYGGSPLLSPPAPAYMAVHNLLTGAPALGKNPNCALTTYPSPNYVYTHNQEARENPPVFFRRALKLVNGSVINLGTTCYGPSPNPPCGLTVAAENSVYIQGNYNATNINFTGNSVAASVVADSVTLLSSSWNDVNSFIAPYDPGNRPGATTEYRAAVIAGKGIPFPMITYPGGGQDYGTDGGVHNFLRYLEGWNGALYYEGSLVSFYYSRQNVGLYKCCNTVYNPPNRQYVFDANFTLGPQWLPPNTPKLRSINTIGFTQMLMPTQ
jgi:Tfp pilus assembly protein PilX